MLNRGWCPKGEPVDRRQRKPPTPAVSHSSHASARLSYPPLHAFSATPPASECPLSTSPTGSPSLSFGYHPRLSMVRLRRRRQLLCTAMTMAVEAEQWWSIDRAVGGVGHRLYIDFFSMCLRRWYDYRLSRYAGAEDFLAHPHYPRRRCELLYFAAGLVLTKLCVELPTDSA